MTDQERIQAKMAEFMKLLPLTVELAGLQRCEHGKMFTDGQMEVRMITLRNAYKLAKQLVLDIAKPPEAASDSGDDKTGETGPIRLAKS